LKSTASFIVRAVGLDNELDVLAGNKLLDHVGTAVEELAGVSPVPRVVVRDGRRTEEDVYGRDARVCRHPVEGGCAAAGLDARLGMAQIEVGA
jgi:hypothetical protein